MLVLSTYADHFRTQPPPPEWLVEALENFKRTDTYANDLCEAFMRYQAVDSTTNAVVVLPQTGEPIPDHLKFYWLPRIRCTDCPGKLYTPGPGYSADNFQVHLKNKMHKEKVELRIRGEKKADA